MAWIIWISNYLFIAEMKKASNESNPDNNNDDYDYDYDYDDYNDDD